MPAPFPDITVPSLGVNTKYCLWQVDVVAEGKRPISDGTDYDCSGVPTIPGQITTANPMILHIQVPAPPPPPVPYCNDMVTLPDGLPPIPHLSTLVASGLSNGPVIHRTSGFGIYSGEFRIISPGNVPLFEGQIELFDGVGTHHWPVSLGPKAENCNEHIEGWLVGQGVPGPRRPYSLHLAIAGHISNPASPAGIQLVLNGVLVLFVP